MKRRTIWTISAALAAPLAVGVLATIARAAYQGAAPELVVTSPKDGAQVRERVKVVVPASAVPAEGFVAVYVDGQFKAAVAPPPADDQATPGSPSAPSPIVYVWDTKAPSTDPMLTAAQKVAQDGPHGRYVRSYDRTCTQLAV